MKHGRVCEWLTLIGSFFSTIPLYHPVSHYFQIIKIFTHTMAKRLFFLMHCPKENMLEKNFAREKNVIERKVDLKKRQI